MSEINDRTIKSLTIVGGGTAGWLSALYLNYYFKDLLSITLIESPEIPTVGAGEATLPAMAQIFSELEISETEFLKECQATFKYGIEFKNWNKASKTRSIWHPFFVRERMLHGIFNLYYHQKATKETYLDLSRFIYPDIDVFYAKKAPRKITDPDYYWELAYAYHFDNLLLARFFSNLAQKRGVNIIKDTVKDIRLIENKVESLILSSGKTIESDLFIDCTGFKGLLIKEQLKASYISVSDQIFCNHALAVKLPYHDKSQELLPFTTVEGLSSGWTWNIPLQNEIGFGYVFSTQHQTPEKALEEMSQVRGFNPDKYNVNSIPMQNGYLENPWIGNCIAIGLSGGFIEPLESTGLHSISLSLELLKSLFPTLDNLENQSRAFNQQSTKVYLDALRFIYLHYCYSDRDDTPFWRENGANKNKDPILTELADQHSNGQVGADIRFIAPNTKVFSTASYQMFLDALIKGPKAPAIASYPYLKKQLINIHEKAKQDSQSRLDLPDLENFYDNL